jgi:hypothetical protein
MKGLLLEIPFFMLGGWMYLYDRWLMKRGRRAPFNEDILRSPGHSARKAQINTAIDLLMYMVVVGAGPFMLLAFMSESLIANWIIGIGGSVVIVYCLYEAVRLYRLMLRLHLGVDAELATGAELNFLMRDGAWVFHDVPYAYGNIDHVVISAGGVFAVETKGFSKPTDDSRSSQENAKVQVSDGRLHFPDGRRSGAPLDQAKRHGNWLRGEIKRRFGFSVPVQAVLALPGWMIEGGYDPDCWVINPRRGNALRHAVTKQTLDSKTVTVIASWIEDLARSVTPKSREYDPKSELSFE